MTHNRVEINPLPDYLYCAKNMLVMRIEPMTTGSHSKRVDCGSGYQIGVFLG